jgi:hypothetical protein
MLQHTRKIILALLFVVIAATTSGCVIPITIDCGPAVCTY